MIPPTMVGVAGRAWTITPRTSEPHAAVATWILHCPASHPLWPWKLLLVVHLDGVDGVAPPVVHFPGATHEFILMALDPDHTPPSVVRVPDVAWSFPPYLTPPDVVRQVILPDHERASQVARLAAEACCSGFLVPDSDHREAWHQTLDLSAEHARLGGHPPEGS